MGSFMTTEFLWAAGHMAIRIVAIALGTVLALRFVNVVASRLFIPKIDMGTKSLYFEEKRARTLSALLRSIIRYSIYFVAIILILQEFHIDTTSLIAGAGIFGLAIGVGAQSLIKDVITGFFIILEDQYAVGDYVVTGTMAGTVEEIGFRVCKLRDANGVLHIIPHGDISRVSNYTRGTMQAAVNIPVAYDADIDKVLAVIQQACDQIGREMPEILDGPNIVGITDIKPGEVVIRVISKTVPLEQVKVETALRHKVKQMFFANQISVPQPYGFKP